MFSIIAQTGTTLYQANELLQQAIAAYEEVKEVATRDTTWQQKFNAAFKCVGVVVSASNLKDSVVSTAHSINQWRLDDMKKIMDNNAKQIVEIQEAVKALEAEKNKERSYLEYLMNIKSQEREEQLKNYADARATHEAKIKELTAQSQDMQKKASEILLNNSNLYFVNFNKEIDGINNQVNELLKKIKSLEKEKTIDRSWVEFSIGMKNEERKNTLARIEAEQKTCQEAIEKLIAKKNELTSQKIKIEDKIKSLKLPFTPPTNKLGLMLGFFCDLVRNFTKEGFANGELNTGMLRKGLGYYLHCYPDSLVAKKLAGKDDVFFASLLAGYLMSTAVKQLTQPADTTHETSTSSSISSPSYKVPSIIKDLPDYIPDEFKEDPVFQEHCCPISDEPIRFPIKITAPDGKVTHHFDKVTIYAWFVQCSAEEKPFTNPLTGLPIQLADCVPDTALQTTIENHLREVLSSNAL